MSDVTKVTMPVAHGAPDNTSYVTKEVMYVGFSRTPATPRRRLIHGKISYTKRMA